MGPWSFGEARKIPSLSERKKSDSIFLTSGLTDEPGLAHANIQSEQAGITGGLQLSVGHYNVRVTTEI
jgi:hypothetical protein